MRVTGVIQAGGKSTRMGGRPKALLKLGGRRIIERVVDAVKPAVDDLLIVTNTPELYTFLGLPMVPDIYLDHGSLGGIYSGLLAAPGDAAFTVACDMPFLHADVARLVVERAGSGDVVIPRVGVEKRHVAGHREGGVARCGQEPRVDPAERAVVEVDVGDHRDRKSTRLNS